MVDVNADICLVCGGCIDLCPKTAMRMVDDQVHINHDKCSECRICIQVCPVGAPYWVEQEA